MNIDWDKEFKGTIGEVYAKQYPELYKKWKEMKRNELKQQYK